MGTVDKMEKKTFDCLPPGFIPIQVTEVAQVVECWSFLGKSWVQNPRIIFLFFRLRKGSWNSISSNGQMNGFQVVAMAQLALISSNTIKSYLAGEGSHNFVLPEMVQ